MEKEKPRLARLTAILTQLQSKRMLTARDIAEKHSVSIRTVYRDIRTLEKSGIPICVEEGKGYYLMEGYKLPPIMFTTEEANALITAEHFINNNKDTSLVEQYKNAIEKIKAVLKYVQKDKAELLTERLQIRDYNKTEKSSHYLIRLQTAITDYKLVEIDYEALDKKKTKRIIEPFALIHTEENWVLHAYCRLRKDFRAFRLDRIQDLKLNSKTFSPHKITLQEYFEAARKKYKGSSPIRVD